MRELYVDDDDDDDGGVGGGAPMRPLLGIFGPSFAHLASHDCIVHFFVPPPPPPQSHVLPVLDRSMAIVCVSKV